MKLEIVKYRFEYINNEPKIIIDMIKLLDDNGKYIRFVKLKEVEPYLSQYPVTFKAK
jgi:hypothetical protein